MSQDASEVNQIGYIYSTKLISESNKIAKIKGRAELVNSLISAYGLFEGVKVVNPLKATEKDLKLFHSQDYIDQLKKYSDMPSETSIDDEYEDDHGLGYDCPIIDDMFEFSSIMAGSSLTAAQLILNKTFKYAINWFGGWHHAKRESASGFCYVNDIVLCISKLRQRFNRILYIDLDLHHGDGVQEAFEFTNKVMTLSFHKWSPGFFPGTGSLEENGKGAGKFYTVNVPFKGGVDDVMFYDSFSKVFKKVLETYRPEVIVTQCGADSLSGDPIDRTDPFNLTVEGYCKVVKLILDSKIPTVFLGGGGYNFSNAARLWCSLVGLITNRQLKNDIPEHDLFLNYSPDYELNTSANLVRNKNSLENVNSMLERIIENLSYVKIE